MSVKVSSWVWHEASDEVNSNELILLLALADVADDNGRCRFLADEDDLTYEGLARKVRVDRRTIERLIPKLRERGLVEQSKGARGRPNEFVVLVPWARVSTDNLSGKGSADGSDSPTTRTDSPTAETTFTDTAGSDSSINVFNVTTRINRSAAEAATTQGMKYAEPLCDVLVAELVRNEAKVPTEVPKQWLADARLLVDSDGRDPREARALIEWACRDSFWRSNILSMPTFRKQYDKLRLARERVVPRRSTVDVGREADRVLRERAAGSERQSVNA